MLPERRTLREAAVHEVEPRRVQVEFREPVRPMQQSEPPVDNPTLSRPVERVARMLKEAGRLYLDEFHGVEDAA
jgi:hypothetical protein